MIFCPSPHLRQAIVYDEDIRVGLLALVHDVLQLQVSMHDSLLVHVPRGGQELPSASDQVVPQASSARRGAFPCGTRDGGSKWDSPKGPGNRFHRTYAEHTFDK